MAVVEQAEPPCLELVEIVRAERDVIGEARKTEARRQVGAVLAHGDDDPETAPSEWPWARALVAEPDPVKLIHRYATHVRTIAPRAGPLVAEIRNAARADPELAAFLAHIEAGRYLGPVGVVALLTEKEALRRGLDADRAAETIFAVASYESYELLVVDRHRTPDEYERWLGDVLCDLLLEPISSRA